MFRVGEKLVCIKNNDEFLIFGKTYTIKKVEIVNGKISYVSIHIDNAWYHYDYILEFFTTSKEYRKMKLKRILC